MNKSKQFYNTRIQKGGTLLEGMRMIVRSWKGIEGIGATIDIRCLLGIKPSHVPENTLIRTFVLRFRHPSNERKSSLHLFIVGWVVRAQTSGKAQIA